MRKLVLSTIPLAFLSVFATPVLADCVQDIKALEVQLVGVKDAKVKEEALGELNEAKKALAKKDEKECVENVNHAKKDLK